MRWLLAPALMLATINPADADCPRQLYAGFDSRLKPRLMATLPKPESDVVEFAINKGKVVALGQRRLLVGANGAGWAAVPILEGTRGMTIARGGLLQLAAGSKVWEISDSGRRELGTFDDTLILRTGKHASPAAIVVRQRAIDRFTIETAASAQEAFVIAELRSKPTAVGWNSNGLSFVSDNTLWVWRPERPELRAMLSDGGLSAARSTCVLPGDRTVVGLDAVTLLASDQHALTIAAFGGLCDVDAAGVALLDPRAGVVWQLGELGNAGNKASDLAHARALVSGAVAGDRSDAVRKSEAMRIVGCSAVEAWEAEQSRAP